MPLIDLPMAPNPLKDIHALSDVNYLSFVHKQVNPAGAGPGKAKSRKHAQFINHTTIIPYPIQKVKQNLLPDSGLPSSWLDRLIYNLRGGTAALPRAGDFGGGCGASATVAGMPHYGKAATVAELPHASRGAHCCGNETDAISGPRCGHKSA